MALWWANSNAWPLSETIEPRQKHSSGQLASLLAGGPETVKRFFAISVLAVISSQRKRNKNPSDLFVCILILGPLRTENYFPLKVPVSRSKRERKLVALLGPLMNYDWL